jgi:putative hydrolase of the HAD superfamily
MSVRAILFDLDNTLLLEDEATERALRQTSERAGADAARVAAAAAEAAGVLFAEFSGYAYADAIGIWWGEALWGGFSGDAPWLRALRAFVPSFRHDVWTRALAAAGIHDAALADACAAAFPIARRALRALDPAAAATLEDLGRDHRLALVTNGAPDVQREKLERSGLGVHFAAVIVSGEVGVGKPDPRVFRAALDGVGVASSDAVMVGDSLSRDIAGAARTGLRAVWLDREGQARDGDIEPDVRIRSLTELRAAIAGLERTGAFPQPA